MGKKIIILISTIALFFSMPGIANAQVWCCTSKESNQYLLKNPPVKNDDISGIQRVLKEFGMYDGIISGLYNQETTDAVRRFQKNSGLPDTGIFDTKTREKLITVFEESPERKKDKPKGKISLLVDVDKKKVTLFNNGKPYKEYPVAVGKVSTPSPIGNWSIAEIDYWPGGPFGSVWMAIKNPWGNYGIHGTDRPWSIGSNASGGCIRMYNNDVLELSKMIETGTPVKIIGTPYSPLYEERRHLQAGMNGADVQEVQRSLFEKGYYKYNIDGMWSWRTQKAIRDFQKDHDFEETGIVDEDMYAALGLN